jgi:hypothetical protein
MCMLPDDLIAENLAAERLDRLPPEFDFPGAPLQRVYLQDRRTTPS